jgi:hypothetical protein
MKVRIPRNKTGKGKINLTLHPDIKRKLVVMARADKRSVSNLIEIMTDDLWERLHT